MKLTKISHTFSHPSPKMELETGRYLGFQKNIKHNQICRGQLLLAWCCCTISCNWLLPSFAKLNIPFYHYHFRRRRSTAQGSPAPSKNRRPRKLTSWYFCVSPSYNQEQKKAQEGWAGSFILTLSPLQLHILATMVTTPSTLGATPSLTCHVHR